MMDRYDIVGGNEISGDIKIQGSKNALLPIMAAALLNTGVTTLDNCPMITDVLSMVDIIKAIGCKVYLGGRRIVIDSTEITNTVIPERYAVKLRGSMLFVGALAARCKSVTMDFPGGCLIGKRPVDFHIEALKKLGAKINIKKERITCTAKKLTGCIIDLPFPSVGATENIIIAAAMAKGTTVVNNAAREPEIADLCKFLSLFGVEISGAGTSRIRISGGFQSREAYYSIMSDRIVAGTYICAAAVTGGSICCQVNNNTVMDELLHTYLDMGLKIEKGNDYIKACAKNRKIKSIDFIETKPYPGFPTDMQSQLISVLSVADGKSIVRENIFENRFHSVYELVNMGADIKIEGRSALITGVKKLYGNDVTSKDLRGGAALIIAGLCAHGHTRVYDSGYIKRGYEDIAGNINMLGGKMCLG